MTYRSILTSLVTLTLAFAAHASIKSDIGYTELKAEFGDALPDGSNLTVMQVEATDSAGYWAVSKSGELSSRNITFPLATKQPTSYSAHAKLVATNLTGTSTSILPTLANLQVASIGTYNTYSLRMAAMESPRAVFWDVENHSLSSSVTMDNLNALQLLDYRINRDLVTVVVALGNGTGPVPPLWGNCYNTITCGTATGLHSRGGTKLDGSGRMKPDLVGPVAYTSYATPVVSSAAGLLIAETKRTASLAVAKDPRTIKALLMAGATKERFPSWSQTSAQPLDPVYGAGQVNINNSYRMLIAGRQSTGAAWRSVKGWDLSQSGSSAVYYFQVPAGQTVKFSTVLAWHRILTTSDSYWSFTGTPADLNLRLRNSTNSFALGTVVAESTSALDNVEHIYHAALPSGYYALEVSGPAGTTYGIAWNAVSATTSTPVVVAPAITTQPIALAVTEGQAAKFSVTASGSTLSYQWTKNGVALPAANASSYTIAAASLDSAGNYAVAVRNSAGSVTSSTASLTVAARPVTEAPSSTTAALTPTDYSARGQNGTKEGVAMLFDGKTATKWLDFSGTSWVQVSFAAPVALSAYSLTSANDYPVRDPATWTLSGSNDGTTWTTVDSRSGESFASRYLKRDFALTQPAAAYLQYRIAMTAKSGSITQLAELAFSAAAAPVVEPTPAEPASTTTVELVPASITARGENGTREGVAKLIDGSKTTKWLDFSGTTWVQVSFATPRALEAYSLTSANDYPVRDPASWTLSGSNDGTTWTVIERRSGEVFASRYLLRDFVLPQTSAAYQHYRIEMTAKSGTITQLAELEFWGR